MIHYVVPPWMRVSEAEYNKNTQEVPGPGANPNIIRYDQCTTLKATSDEVPWCSAYENYIIQNCGLGYKGTQSAAALSWLKWGKSVDARYGAIAVFDHGGGKGHVTNFICLDPTNKAYGLFIGGNQSDRVKITRYLMSSVKSFRWPSSFAASGGYG